MVAIWCVLALIVFLQLFATIHRALVGRTWPMWQLATPPQPVAPSARMDEQPDEPVDEPLDEPLDQEYQKTSPRCRPPRRSDTSEFATEIPLAD